MNLDELRSVQAKERRKDSLQHLRDSFYGDVAAYIGDLKAQRKRAAEAAADPFSSPEVGRLTDEIETAEEVVDAIYERRVGKVVKLASFAAADMPVDEEGLTSEERELFDDLVVRIEENRATVLDTLAGSRGRPAESDGADATEAADAPRVGEESVGAAGPTPSDGNVLADAMGGASTATGASGEGVAEPDAPPADETAAAPSADAVRGGDRDGGDARAESDDGPATTAEPNTERTTVRITRDVGAILGVDDREYDLAREDVVTLPAANAEPLLQRNAAERID
jgi:DNA replication factor GINS